MARKFSQTNMSIWSDTDWRALPFPAQGVYRMLWDHPQLSYCGVVDWRPTRLCSLADGLTPDVLQQITDCLQARHFIVLDEETEECLVRSWVRFDGLMTRPHMAVSFANAYAVVSSNTLRGVIVHEMTKLRQREPDAAGWQKPAVQQMFDHPAIDAKGLSTPTDPFPTGVSLTLSPAGSSLRSPAVRGDKGDGVHLPGHHPPTPAPSPTPYSISGQVGVSEDVTAPAAADAAGSENSEDDLFEEFWTRWPQARRIKKVAARKAWVAAVKKVDDPWTIINAARGYSVTVHGSEPRFIAHASTWLNGERWNDEPEPDPLEAPDGSVYEPPHVDDLETPPDGLSEDAYREWDRGYRERLKAKREARQAARR